MQSFTDLTHTSANGSAFTLLQMEQLYTALIRVLLITFDEPDPNLPVADTFFIASFLDQVKGELWSISVVKNNKKKVD